MKLYLLNVTVEYKTYAIKQIPSLAHVPFMYLKHLVRTKIHFSYIFQYYIHQKLRPTDIIRACTDYKLNNMKCAY